VGQNDWEEVDKVELGGNYGWRIMEGNACYNPTNCSDAGLIRPHAVYPTSASSVVAGEVYYGSDLPELTGVLLYSDYYDGDIYGLFSDAITGLPAPALVANSNRTVVDFAAGADGEVYVADHGNGGIYRLERLGTTPVDPFPQTLTETGCFDASDATQPVEGMIPYTTSHAFWSDGAAKDRWFAIPDGTTITVGDDGDWELPIGSVTVKHFDLDGQRVETRLLVRHDDGEWAGYAYAWDAGGADATLLAGGLLVDTGGQEWSVPSRSDCMLCHTTAAGGSLGFETMQLNVEHDYPASGLRANQLATLDHIGMFTAALGDPDTLPVLPARGDVAASVEDQARAYLHTNCSQCHRPGGPGRGDLDMRWSTALADMNLCDVPPEHGDLDLGGSARVLAPGDPAASVISNRMHRRDAYQMPPLGSTEVDAEGAAWVDAWIASLSSCP